MAAPKGNRNAVKHKPWQDAIKRAMARYDSKNGKDKALNTIADQLLEAAFNGDQWAITEIANRLDGKPVQQTEVTGEDGGPIETKDVSDMPVGDAARRVIFLLQAAMKEQEDKGDE